MLRSWRWWHWYLSGWNCWNPWLEQRQKKSCVKSQGIKPTVQLICVLFANPKPSWDISDNNRGRILLNYHDFQKEFERSKVSLGFESEYSDVQACATWNNACLRNCSIIISNYHHHHYQKHDKKTSKVFVLKCFDWISLL